MMWFKNLLRKKTAKEICTEGRDRRKFPRVKTCNLLKITLPAEDSIPILTNFVNVSEGGLQLTFPKRIIPNTTCRFVLNFAESDLQVPVTGKVVWAKRQKNHRHSYRMGISFLEMNDDDRCLIRELVEGIIAQCRSHFSGTIQAEAA